MEKVFNRVLWKKNIKKTQHFQKIFCFHIRFFLFITPAVNLLGRAALQPDFPYPAGFCWRFDWKTFVSKLTLFGSYDSYLEPPLLFLGCSLTNLSYFYYMLLDIAEECAQQCNQDVEYLCKPALSTLAARFNILFFSSERWRIVIRAKFKIFRQEFAKNELRFEPNDNQWIIKTVCRSSLRFGLAWFHPRYILPYTLIEKQDSFVGFYLLKKISE